MEVTVDGRDLEKAIRALKRKIQRDGVFRELKNRRFYEKPSLRKKRKKLEARKRRAKALRRSGQGNRPQIVKRTVSPARQDPAR